jgi:hypothetical protein
MRVTYAAHHKHLNWQQKVLVQLFEATAGP